MTSANVIEYRIFKDGIQVGKHYQNLLCKDRSKELLKYSPPEDFTIQAHGKDEHEAPWENEPVNLLDFLKKYRWFSAPMTPPPPTPNPMPKTDSGAGAVSPSKTVAVPRSLISELVLKLRSDGRTIAANHLESYLETPALPPTATQDGQSSTQPESEVKSCAKTEPASTSSQPQKKPESQTHSCETAKPSASNAAPPQSDPALAAAEWRPMETAPKDGTWVEGDFQVVGMPKRELRWVDGVWFDRDGFSFDPRYHFQPKLWRPLAPAPAPEGRGETPAAVQPIEYLTRYTCSVNGMVPAEDGPWVSFRQAKAAQDEVRESANYWNQQWNKQTIERDAAVACETKIRQYITEAMGHEACEGCDTPQLVAILISQRDNARNESDALKTAHASASRCARAAEAIELRKQLETKEQHRQYHMNAINRLAKVVGAEGEQSEDVVSVAVAAVAQAQALREARDGWQWWAKYGRQMRRNSPDLWSCTFTIFDDDALYFSSAMGPTLELLFKHAKEEQKRLLASSEAGK